MTTPPPSREFWPDWLTPRRAVQFVVNVVRLENDVATLKSDVSRLREQMAGMREQNAAQAAKIEILTGLLSALIAERAGRPSDVSLALLLEMQRRGEEEEKT